MAEIEIAEPPQVCRLLSLPEECIDLIGGQLELHDLNSLVQACSLLYRIFFGTLCRLYEAKTPYSGTCIDWAVIKGGDRVSTVNRAIKDGNVKPRLYTLTLACAAGQIQVVRRLLQVVSVVEEWKAQSLKDEEPSPLACALQRGADDVVDILLAVPDVVDAAIQASVSHQFDSISIKPAVLLAATQNKAKYIQPLLDRGANIESTGSTGHTALQEAALYGSSDAFLELVRLGADYDKAYENEVTMMHIAARHNVAMVQCLLDRGLSPRVSTRKGRTPLFEAISFDRDDILRLLIEHGALFTTDDRRRTPLMEAAYSCAVTAVRTLMTMKDVDVHARDDWDRTALFHTVSAEHGKAEKIAQVCESLLMAGAYPNAVSKSGSVALAGLCDRRISRSVDEAYADIYRCMVRFGLSDLDPSLHDMCLAKWALEYEQTSLLEAMEGAGVRIDFSEGAIDGCHYSVGEGYSHSLRMWKWMMERGLHVGVRDVSGRPLLHGVLDRWRSVERRFLLDAGADIEARDLDGNTALHYACDTSRYQTRTEAITDLIKRGANMWSRNDDGLTPLDIAKSAKAYAMVKIFERHMRKQSRARCKKPKRDKSSRMDDAPDLGDLNLDALFDDAVFLEA